MILTNTYQPSVQQYSVYFVPWIRHLKVGKYNEQ